MNLLLLYFFIFCFICAYVIASYYIIKQRKDTNINVGHML